MVCYVYLRVNDYCSDNIITLHVMMITVNNKHTQFIHACMYEPSVLVVVVYKHVIHGKYTTCERIPKSS